MKRLYYFIAACLLCIFLAACGDKNAVTQKPDISGPALSPTGQADPGKDPTPTQGLADNYITSHRHVSVHDPSVEYDNGKYYIFGSHLACAVTEDLVSWNYVKNSNSGYSKNNGLFKTYDTVFAKPGDYVGGTDQLWAPDVIYNKAMGKYCMYMSVSGTTCMSCIALAVSDSIEGPYEYVDTILYSGFTAGTVGKTDVLKVLGVNSLSETHYNYDGKSSNADFPNCIDPTVFYGGDGKLYMVYGSMSGGIFMLLLDEKTGLVDRTRQYTGTNNDAYFGVRVAGGQRKTGEGSYIMYDDESGYYYLFVTYGYLNAHCGYQIREFRSEDPFGPYTDPAGNEATVAVGGGNADKGIKLFGDYDFACLSKAYVSAGHNSAVKTSEGEYFLIYHQRFNSSGEIHEVRVHKMLKNADGWLLALPYEYSGEKDLSENLSAEEVEGYYEFINHGLDVQVASTPIYRSELIYLGSNGVVSYSENTDSAFGTWSFEGNNGRVKIKLGNDSYTGNFARQLTENDHRETLVFSAVSDENTVIWGSKLDNEDGQTRVKRDAVVAKTYIIPAETKENLVFPETGDFLSTYTWKSSNTAVIGDDGTIHRPLEDTKVDITVTVRSGDYSEEITKTVKVLGGLEPNSTREDGVVAIYTFKPGEELKDSSGNGYDLINFGVTFENGVAVFDGKSYLQFPAAVTRAEIQSVIIKFAVDDYDSENPILTISDDVDDYFRFFVSKEGRIVADAEALKLSGTQATAVISGIGEWQRFGFNNGGTDNIDSYKGGSIAALNGDRAWRGRTFGGFIGLEIEGKNNFIGRDLEGEFFMRGKIEEIIFYNTYIGETGLKTCFE